jgi:hypothetical protein
MIIETLRRQKKMQLRHFFRVGGSIILSITIIIRKSSLNSLIINHYYSSLSSFEIIRTSS